jgi:hypothetical protein
LDPLEIIALIEDGLHAPEDHSEENEADAIEAGDAAMEAPAINQRAGDPGDRQGDRDIQIKKVTPAEFVGDPAAHGKGDGEWHHGEHSPNPQSHRFVPRGIFFQHQGPADGEGNAAGEPKKNARR